MSVRFAALVEVAPFLKATVDLMTASALLPKPFGAVPAAVEVAKANSLSSLLFLSTRSRRIMVSKKSAGISGSSSGMLVLVAMVAVGVCCAVVEFTTLAVLSIALALSGDTWLEALGIPFVLELLARRKEAPEKG
jgi:hypothetical protein